MFDRETWRFFNTFAPWFSALGTITAVIVSLYLARRSSRLDLRVSATIVTLVTQGETHRPEFFQIRAVNHGRDAVVTGLGWFYRGIKKRNWVQLPPANLMTTKLPTRLEFGEDAKLHFPLTAFYKDFGPLVTFIGASRFPSLRVRLLRVAMFTSTGQVFRVPLDRHVRDFMLERVAQAKASANQ